MLAGVVAAERRGRLRGLAWFVIPTAVIGLPISLPLLPVPTAGITAKANQAVAETVGWPELTRRVSDVVRSLPADERSSVMLLAATYGEAGALDRFCGSYGLPHPFSGHNSYADFRQPTDDAATVVAVRYPSWGAWNGCASTQVIPPGPVREARGTECHSGNAVLPYRVAAGGRVVPAAPVRHDHAARAFVVLGFAAAT